jgi:prepilin-type N-terminal cleavage/methylation domain-containing protein
VKREKGFTLIEILVVVGIIALIAAIGIPNLLRARLSANEALAQANLKSIASALETYLNKDYFTGVQSGYVYAATVASYSYSIMATPDNQNSGRVTYTITTGSVLSSSP